MATVQPIGRNLWATAGMALVVTGVIVSGQRRASGAERRARLTSSATALVLMAILGVGAGSTAASDLADTFRDLAPRPPMAAIAARDY